jgi:hypothetical protein
MRDPLARVAPKQRPQKRLTSALSHKQPPSRTLGNDQLHIPNRNPNRDTTPETIEMRMVLMAVIDVA